MKAAVLILTCILSLQVAPAFGARIAKVGPAKGALTLSLENANDFDVNDSICVQSGKRVVGCGLVVRTGPRELMASLTLLGLSLREGDSVDVQRMKEDPTRKIDSLPFIENQSAYHYDQKNISVGLKTTALSLRFAQAIAEKWCLGLLGTFGTHSAGNGSLSGYEFGVTLQYFSKEPYSGIWAYSVLGMALVNVAAPGQVPEDAGYNPFIAAAAGYRHLWPSGWNVGGAVGAQYYFSKIVPTFDFEFGGILPVVMLDFGYLF